MAGMYPKDETITMFGKKVRWPGLDPGSGKFTNGDFNNPENSPSFIPAETINLILDNLSTVISNAGIEPNPEDPRQLINALKEHILNDVLIGEIRMYDADNPGASGTGLGASGPWVDNVTRPGWYACIPENADKGCPNLVARFPLGKSIAGSGTHGGNEMISLTAKHLPGHTHSINHGHGASSATMSADHVHGITATNITGSFYNMTYSAHANASGNFSLVKLTSGHGFNGNSDKDTNMVTLNGNHSHGCGGSTANHTHGITVNNHTGNSGITGNNEAVNIMNPYYSVIYIRKCE